MKRIWIYFFTALSMAGIVQANEECCDPISLSLGYDYISDSKFDKHGFNHSHIHYSNTYVEADYMWWVNPKCHEASSFLASFTHENIHWKQNPYFSQQRFNTLSLGIGASTRRFEDWCFEGMFKWNIDTNNFYFNQYSTFDLMLYGRRNFNCFCIENIGFNIGFYAQTGMKMDRLYPILGFDWNYPEKWKFHLIFPIDMSVTYQMSKKWSVDLAIRSYESRHRVGRDEPIPLAVLAYRNHGIEAGINYYPLKCIEAGIHAGYMFGGTYKIANHNNRHPHHFDFEGAPYAGAEFFAKF